MLRGLEAQQPKQHRQGGDRTCLRRSRSQIPSRAAQVHGTAGVAVRPVRRNQRQAPSAVRSLCVVLLADAGLRGCQEGGRAEPLLPLAPQNPALHSVHSRGHQQQTQDLTQPQAPLSPGHPQRLRSCAPTLCQPSPEISAGTEPQECADGAARSVCGH